MPGVKGFVDWNLRVMEMLQIRNVPRRLNWRCPRAKRDGFNNPVGRKNHHLQLPPKNPQSTTLTTQLTITNITFPHGHITTDHPNAPFLSSQLHITILPSLCLFTFIGENLHLLCQLAKRFYFNQPISIKAK